MNYIDHSLIVFSEIAGWVSISAFASLVSNPISITSSAIGLKVCVTTAGIEKYKPINRKKEKQTWHNSNFSKI